MVLETSPWLCMCQVPLAKGPFQFVCNYDELHPPDFWWLNTATWILLLWDHIIVIIAFSKPSMRQPLYHLPQPKQESHS